MTRRRPAPLSFSPRQGERPGQRPLLRSRLPLRTAAPPRRAPAGRLRRLRLRGDRLPGGLVGRRGPGHDHRRRRLLLPLLPLLHGPVPATRIRAAHALATATATDLDGTVRTALRARFAAEPAPDVCAALLLAIADIARARPDPPTTGLLRAYWQDHARAPEVRPATAIGWLCLTDGTAPDDLRAAVDRLATDERARTMDGLPWTAAAGGSGGTGLRRCLRTMLHPEQPDPRGYDDPWAPRS
ncbi:hypothetical protein [Kitasatospora sp. NPDC088134]|uniref:hypothetical protein n=1 Tax=Kitasatospora sp. NPDC088134 TaxID=3364071 RepID=UPI003816012B